LAPELDVPGHLSEDTLVPVDDLLVLLRGEARIREVDAGAERLGIGPPVVWKRWAGVGHVPLVSFERLGDGFHAARPQIDEGGSEAVDVLFLGQAVVLLDVYEVADTGCIPRDAVDVDESETVRVVDAARLVDLVGPRAVSLEDLGGRLEQEIESDVGSTGQV